MSVFKLYLNLLADLMTFHEANHVCLQAILELARALVSLRATALSYPA